MPRKPTLPLLALPFLAACFGPGLAGDWEGDLACDDVDFELSAELESDGGGEYEGSMVWSAYEEITEDGVYYELEMDFLYDLQIETDGFGEQDLDGDVELDNVRCRLFGDGELLTDDCDDLDLDVDLGAGGDIDGFTWDGADTIEIDTGSCEGELERD